MKPDNDYIVQNDDGSLTKPDGAPIFKDESNAAGPRQQRVAASTDNKPDLYVHAALTKPFLSLYATEISNASGGTEGDKPRPQPWEIDWSNTAILKEDGTELSQTEKEEYFRQIEFSRLQKPGKPKSTRNNVAARLGNVRPRSLNWR